MKTISLNLPEACYGKLVAFARERGKTRSEVIRMALEEFLRAEPPRRPGSCLDLARDLAGCVEGPGDLSYSKPRLDGYGR